MFFVSYSPVPNAFNAILTHNSLQGQCVVRLLEMLIETCVQVLQSYIKPLLTRYVFFCQQCVSFGVGTTKSFCGELQMNFHSLQYQLIRTTLIYFKVKWGRTSTDNVLSCFKTLSQSSNYRKLNKRTTLRYKMATTALYFKFK